MSSPQIKKLNLGTVEVPYGSKIASCVNQRILEIFLIIHHTLRHFLSLAAPISHTDEFVMISKKIHSFDLELT